MKRQAHVDGGTVAKKKRPTPDQSWVDTIIITVEFGGAGDSVTLPIKSTDVTAKEILNLAEGECGAFGTRLISISEDEELADDDRPLLRKCTSFMFVVVSPEFKQDKLAMLAIRSVCKKLNGFDGWKDMDNYETFDQLSKCSGVTVENGRVTRFTKCALNSQIKMGPCLKYISFKCTLFCYES